MKRGVRFVLAASALALIGCSPSNGGRSGGSFAVAPVTSAAPPAVVAPVSSTAPVASAAPTNLTGEEGAYPLVLVHGISAGPGSWGTVGRALSKGRTLQQYGYAAELKMLAPGSISRSAVFSIEYYKRDRKDPDYSGGFGSIGGCPVPRTDGVAPYYPIAWVDIVDECVEAILKATGAPRVDMAGASMGGVVSRAYVTWRSGRGPGGESRVRRLTLVESPSRGVNDLEAIAATFENRPFQSWGEIAEMARDYPGWQGRSYIHHLNAEFDPFCRAHGVTYGGVFGSGYRTLSSGIINFALPTVMNVIKGPPTPAPSPTPSPAPAPSPAPTPAPAPPPGPPTLGMQTTPLAQTVARALRFLDLTRFDLFRDVSETFGDGDGAIRSSSSDLSATAGPEFPGARFSTRFFGTHVDMGSLDSSLQDAVNTREVIRRFSIEEREPRGTKIVVAAVRAVSAPGMATWLAVSYELKGSDGLSLQLEVDDGSGSLPKVYGAPTFEGRRQLRFEGGAPGWRSARLVFYDMDGIVGVTYPAPVLVQTGAKEVAPVTSFVGSKTTAQGTEVSVASNGAGAEFSWRLVAPSSVGAWSAWTTTPTFVLPAALRAGTYELFVRSRHAANAVKELVEEADPLELGVRVDGQGRVTVRR